MSINMNSFDQQFLSAMAERTHATGEMTLDELDDVVAGIPPAAVERPEVGISLDELTAETGELSLAELDKIKAGMPQAMVADQIECMQGQASRQR